MRIGEIMAIAIRLSEELENKLSLLAKKTKRSKSYYAKKAIKEFIEDREDYLLAVAALEESKEFVSLEEARKRLGMDS